MELITVRKTNEQIEFYELADKLPVSSDEDSPIGFLIEKKKMRSCRTYAWEDFNRHGDKVIKVTTRHVPRDKKGTHALVWREK